MINSWYQSVKRRRSGWRRRLQPPQARNCVRRMTESEAWSAPGVRVLVSGAGMLLAGIALLVLGIADSPGAGPAALIVAGVVLLIAGACRCRA